jgi:hypothetical protein
MVAKVKRNTRKTRSTKGKIRPAARFRAGWEPPADYEPMPGLGAYLKSISPPMNTAEIDMVIYWDWRTRPFWRKTVAKAWEDLGMTPAHAQGAFVKRLIMMEIYDRAVVRARATSTRARMRAMPRA